MLTSLHWSSWSSAENTDTVERQEGFVSLLSDSVICSDAGSSLHSADNGTKLALFSDATVSNADSLLDGNKGISNGDDLSWATLAVQEILSSPSALRLMGSGSGVLGTTVCGGSSNFAPSEPRTMQLGGTMTCRPA